MIRPASAHRSVLPRPAHRHDPWRPAEDAKLIDVTTPDELAHRFRDGVAALPDPDGTGSTGGGPLGWDAEVALGVFDAQLESRHLDLAARWMQERGRGHYTISSAGHEGNAAVAAALRPSDPALLHYRSGGFYAARARQVPRIDPGINPVRDVLLGVAAATEEPIAGGRHKVFGRAELNIVPQTSTIASHLPRAVGTAWSIDRAARLGVGCPWPAESVVCCSFGDASINHSSALGAINAACHTAYQGVPMPLLLVCEDNGLGISVPTPAHWIRDSYAAHPGLRYVGVDGCDAAATYAAASAAAGYVRTRRRPALLHLSVVRLLGHAGSDAETAYRSPGQITADLARDPVLHTAAQLVRAGVLTRDEVLERDTATRARVRREAQRALSARPLRSAAEVTAPLAVRRPAAVAADVRRRPGAEGAPVTVAQAINAVLAEQLAARPELVVFGQDVGRKGGVYGVTRGLQRRFGAARVFDTLLDEQSVLGLALGAGISGLLPVPEIQYLAYLHNAVDQLRGEAATLPFFSTGRYRNPMVVRIASFADPGGFGGHFHNDSALPRDVPGLVLAAPALPDDAAAMLRTCVAAAAVDATVSLFLEPTALYHQRDRHAEGDRGWLAPLPSPTAHVPIGRARTHGDGADITLVTFGTGVRCCLRVARRLADEDVAARVLDLRWLAPLPLDDLLREAQATGRTLVVDETRRTGGVAEGVLTVLAEAGYRGLLRRVTGADSFVPLGAAARLVLVSEDDVLGAARALLAR